MAGPSTIPVLMYGAEAAATEDLRILFGSGQQRPDMFDGLGPAFEAELYRSIFGDADFPAVELTAVSDDRMAVEEVGRAIAEGRRFRAAFIDLGSPPGNWGLDVAAAVRELDPYLHIVLIATRCDLGPAEICARVPPADRLCVLSKPFQPLEVQHQVLAAEARSRADRLVGPIASWSGDAEKREADSGGVRSVMTDDLAELLSLLRATLSALLDEPRARPPVGPPSGRPAHGLAEPAPRFESGGGTAGSTLESAPGAQRKRQGQAKRKPEGIADV